LIAESAPAKQFQDPLLTGNELLNRRMRAIGSEDESRNDSKMDRLEIRRSQLRKRKGEASLWINRIMPRATGIRM